MEDTRLCIPSHVAMGKRISNCRNVYGYVMGDELCRMVQEKVHAVRSVMLASQRETEEGWTAVHARMVEHRGRMKS